MARLVDVDAFLLGMKPAHYGNTGCPTTMKYIDKLKRYPYVTNGIDISDDDYFLFFQNNELKNEFLDKLKNVKPRSPEFHKLLGVTLGYPPAAARFFATCMSRTSLESYRLAIHYAGIRCVSHVDDLVENAIWLWDRYTEQEDMKIMVNTSLYPVIRYDIERLNEIKRIQQQQIIA
ncbi:hypothetical protein [Shimazuella kribbensis]|uniref:hypothetical protein n=1 Tax=Shimazuella kribbensis TaxID=139808 RepID=UPI0004902125|nr:hypothetical protein [Shimazuella kribbensis]